MFSKFYKNGLEWKRMILSDGQIEKMRIKSIDESIYLFAFILEKVKAKFPKDHPLTQERIALAVFDKKEDAFYSEVHNKLDEMIAKEQEKAELPPAVKNFPGVPPEPKQPVKTTG